MSAASRCWWSLYSSTLPASSRHSSTSRKQCQSCAMLAGSTSRKSLSRLARAFGRWTPSLFARLLAAYPQQATEAAFNLLGSHATPRLLTLGKGDKRRMKLATVIQFTFAGTPCIYYGDEVGLDGGQDPGCRKCMEWDEAKQD